MMLYKENLGVAEYKNLELERLLSDNQKEKKGAENHGLLDNPSPVNPQSSNLEATGSLCDQKLTMQKY